MYIHGCMTAEVGLTVSQSLVSDLSSSFGMKEMWTGLCPVLVTTRRRDWGTRKLTLENRNWMGRDRDTQGQFFPLHTLHFMWLSAKSSKTILSSKWLNRIFIVFTTVESLNKGHFGISQFVLSRTIKFLVQKMSLSRGSSFESSTVHTYTRLLSSSH